ncbi:MAG: class I SAM-dependent methyltransferase [Chitinophagales bacterium]
MSESKHERCLLCNNPALKALARYSMHHLVECEHCGFVFAGMIPDTSTLLRHYEGYGRRNYLSPITVKRYRELLVEFEKFRNQNRIIDVGCGIGFFLDVAKETGWNVFGTEYTDEAIRICREKGISMQQGVLNAGNYEPGSFDVITSFEVMEHINNPVEEVQKFQVLLRTGGLVYVTTPNFNSLSRLLLKEKWNVIAYPEHLSYYTTTTLKKLFKDAGFSVFKIQTTGVSITRAKTSLSISKQAFVSATSDDEKLRRTIESSRLMRNLKSAANKTLSLFNSGDTIKATFIKM